MKNEKPYSIVHYILWVIAGSEISVLKKCPNDYNRHANIGLMIFITSLFASMTAFLAGSTFVHDNYKAVAIFAIIWAFLIFSLDRSMVNSIKKDPTEPDRAMLGYFWPRLVLAIILSFFMSIPLDHIVFKEPIRKKLLDNNNKAWLKNQEDLNKGYDTKNLQKNLEVFTSQSENLKEEINNPCPLPEYRDYLREYEQCNKEIKPLRESSYRLTNQYKQLRLRINNGEKLTISEDFKQQEYRAAQNYSRKLKECNSAKEKASAVYTKWRLVKEREKADVDSLKNITQNTIVANNETIQDQSERYKREMEEMQGFATQFVVLFLMPDWGVQFLKWLIFLALLVIEILPTYLKLKTPVGQYDWEMYRREATTELETRTKIDGLRNELKDIEEYRVENEISLNKKIIDKVVSIEEKLANEMLIEWENKAREQMKKNIENAD